MTPPAPAAAPEAIPSDRELVERVLAGDEAAFERLVGRHHRSLLRVAGALLPSAALAEELVQDCWIAALDHLEDFQGRAAFKSWLTAIVTNRARTLAARERWIVPGLELDEPAVPRDRFSASGRSWARPPARWSPDFPETVVHRAQIRGALTEALETLPPAQRAVVVLRDVEGLSAEEVCEAMSISAANQRVLLHRGRARLRNLLEGFADGL